MCCDPIQLSRSVCVNNSTDTNYSNKKHCRLLYCIILKIKLKYVCRWDIWLVGGVWGVAITHVLTDWLRLSISIVSVNHVQIYIHVCRDWRTLIVLISTMRLFGISFEKNIILLRPISGCGVTRPTSLVSADHYSRFPNRATRGVDPFGASQSPRMALRVYLNKS